MSGPEFYGIAAGVINASPRPTVADAALRTVLGTMGAILVEAACITVPVSGTRMTVSDVVRDPAPRDRIVEALSTLAASPSRMPAE